MHSNSARKSSTPDYDEEARKLFRTLNLPEDGSGVVPGRYNPMDVLWRNEKTGAKVFVGNHMAAKDKNLLAKHEVSCIVNCQDVTTTNYFEGDPSYSYFRFPISHWRSVNGIQGNSEIVRKYFKDVFAWIDKATAEGRSVLIHCLAGAHRAGTTGVAFLMHATGLSDTDAISAAKRLRPMIDPICDFPYLLRSLCKSQHS